MSDPTLESLTLQVAELTEQLRVAEHQLASLATELDEARALPNPAAKEFWHGYKSATLMGAFDVRDISSWEGSKLRVDGPWNYKLYNRWTSRVVALDQEQFDVFAPRFDAYLKANP